MSAPTIRPARSCSSAPPSPSCRSSPGSAWRGDLVNSVRTSNIGGHLLRGIISSCGMFAGFVALAYLPLLDAVAIGYASPLMVVVLAALILHEKVRAYRWSAVAIGFVGVLIMLIAAPLRRRAGSRGSPADPRSGRCSRSSARSARAGATIQVRRLLATEQHRRHRALLLADDDRPRPRDDRARLARADRRRVRAPRRDRHPRRHRPDPPDAKLPLRRRLARSRRSNTRP